MLKIAKFVARRFWGKKLAGKSSNKFAKLSTLHWLVWSLADDVTAGLMTTKQRPLLVITPPNTRRSTVCVIL